MCLQVLVFLHKCTFQRRSIVYCNKVKSCKSQKDDIFQWNLKVQPTNRLFSTFAPWKLKYFVFQYLRFAREWFRYTLLDPRTHCICSWGNEQSRSSPQWEPSRFCVVVDNAMGRFCLASGTSNFLWEERARGSVGKRVARGGKWKRFSNFTKNILHE